MWDLASQDEPRVLVLLLVDPQSCQLPTRQHSPKGILFEDAGPSHQDEPRILVLLLIDAQSCQLPTRQHSPEGILLEDA